MLASPFANSSLPDYVAACNPAALAGARIGVPANLLELNAPYLASAELSAFHAALTILAAASVTIVPDANFTAFAEYAASNSETLVLNADFLVNLRAYLATLTVNPTDLADLAGVRGFTRAFTRAFGPED
ncbi:putative glutamyl-tRNA amidotransferase subunit a protein [Neofusicoccum parvum]|uniref:Glutamyl-tRNA amidotransferase subunit a protein n=1 Tax=Neofusicoccum parvum TaxID=310453 RepID=A0ACB5SF77_9PEZI|nr:putative glutamyl-tRNA amidotransferase subunit a protein [Neofusicoccum parvum]